MRIAWLDRLGADGDAPRRSKLGGPICSGASREKPKPSRGIMLERQVGLAVAVLVVEQRDRIAPGLHVRNSKRDRWHSRARYARYGVGVALAVAGSRLPRAGHAARTTPLIERSPGCTCHACRRRAGGGATPSSAGWRARDQRAFHELRDAAVGAAQPIPVRGNRARSCIDTRSWCALMVARGYQPFPELREWTSGAGTSPSP